MSDRVSAQREPIVKHGQPCQLARMMIMTRSRTTSQSWEKRVPAVLLLTNRLERHLLRLRKQRSPHYPNRTSSLLLVSLDLAFKSQHLMPVLTSSRSLIFQFKMRSLLQDPLFLRYLRIPVSPPLERESGQ